MTQKKFLIIAVATLAGFFILFHSLRYLEKSDEISRAPRRQEKALAALESQVKELQGIVNTFEQFNVSLHKAFTEEKEKAMEARENALSLQDELKNALSQKEAVSKELTEAKAKLELTKPIKQKLIQIEGLLSGITFSPDGQSQTIAQLEALANELDSLDQQVPYLLNENNSFKLQVQNLSELLQKKEQELALLRQQMNLDFE